VIMGHKVEQREPYRVLVTIRGRGCIAYTYMEGGDIGVGMFGPT
jgi:hypothetical protein